VFALFRTPTPDMFQGVRAEDDRIKLEKRI
jgi:hypothetical protein